MLNLRRGGFPTGVVGKGIRLSGSSSSGPGEEGSLELGPARGEGALPLGGVLAGVLLLLRDLLADLSLLVLFFLFLPLLSFSLAVLTEVENE